MSDSDHGRHPEHGLRRTLPRDPSPRPALRRAVHHGRELHGDLLPAVLPGSNPEAGERHLLRDERRGARGRFPRMQAVPS
ncbi:hypothetical protein PLANTIT3_10068 [Plantibacter sp. T3]|nr:hypothetical protein PLANTIT3_10068 [Plantibacter sp. T3]